MHSTVGIAMMMEIKWQLTPSYFIISTGECCISLLCIFLQYQVVMWLNFSHEWAACCSYMVSLYGAPWCMPIIADMGRWNGHIMDKGWAKNQVHHDCPNTWFNYAFFKIKRTSKGQNGAWYQFTVWTAYEQNAVCSWVKISGDCMLELVNAVHITIASILQ